MRACGRVCIQAHGLMVHRTLYVFHRNSLALNNKQKFTLNLLFWCFERMHICDVNTTGPSLNHNYALRPGHKNVTTLRLVIPDLQPTHQNQLQVWRIVVIIIKVCVSLLSLYQTVPCDSEIIRL